MNDLAKIPSVATPVQTVTPPIHIPDADVDKAASELGYAVIKGKDFRHLATLGKAAGESGHIHIGRAWLMMAQSAANKMVDQLDTIIDSEDNEENKDEALRLKQKVLTSMVCAAKTMIESDSQTTQGSGSAPVRLAGFGPGVAGMPMFPIQINMSPAVNNEPKQRHVSRNSVEAEPVRSGGNASKPEDEDPSGDD